MERRTIHRCSITLLHPFRIEGIMENENFSRDNFIRKFLLLLFYRKIATHALLVGCGNKRKRNI